MSHVDESCLISHMHASYYMAGTTLVATVCTDFVRRLPNLAKNLQILTLGNRSLCADTKSFPRDATLRPQPRPPTPESQYLSQNKTMQWLVPPSSLPSAPISYGDCWVCMHSEC